FVLFHLRQNFVLVLAPLGLLIVQQGLLRTFTGLEQSDWFRGAMLLLVPGVLVAMPWLVRYGLGLVSMPPGPDRDRLGAASRRLNFRCTDLLVWNTGGGSANAMVVGLVPALRYVVFTDRLLSDLTPAEVEAVFGHEVGHVKHGHILYYAGFLV